MIGLRAGVVVLTLLAACQVVLAQPPGPGYPPAERIEFAAGLAVDGNWNLGGSAATLTPNAGGTSFTLFEAQATYARPAGVDMRVLVRLTPWLLVGGQSGWQRGPIEVHVTDDAEGAADVSFGGEPVGQFTAEGRIDLQAPVWAVWQGRITPYMVLCGGYLRQWHDGRTVIETGTVWRGGAGLRARVWERPTGWLTSVGVTAEAKVTYVSGGFHWGHETRTAPSFSLAVTTGWGRCAHER